MLGMMTDDIRLIDFDSTCDSAWSSGVSLCITAFMTGVQLVEWFGIGS